MQEEFEVKAELCAGQQEWWVVIVVVAEVEALRVREVLAAMRSDDAYAVVCVDNLLKVGTGSLEPRRRIGTRTSSTAKKQREGRVVVVDDVFVCLFGAGFVLRKSETEAQMAGRSECAWSTQGRAVTEAIEEKAGSSTRHCDVQGQLNDSDSIAAEMMT